MARRRRVLLEVVRDSVRPDTGGGAPPGRAAPNGGGWFSGGRVVRAPIGYCYTAATVVLVCVLAAYLVGHARGQAESGAQAAAQLRSALRSGGDSPSYDPVVQQRGSPGAGAGADAKDAAGVEQGVEQGVQEGAQRLDGGSPVVLPVFPAADRRVPGLNYYRVAYDTPAEAQRLAAFLTDRGLASSALPADRPDRLVVYVVEPGFESFKSPEVKRLRSAIHKAGRDWKAAGGSSDLTDAYPEKHSIR